VKIMLTLESMRQLRDAYDPHLPASEKEVFELVGNPTPDEIIETALAGLKSEDRNVRVLMLRVLKWQTGEKAMRGILAGLGDKVRRVRVVAIKASGNYHQFPEITNRLREIVTDEQEKRKIRGEALGSLAGAGGSVVEVVEDLTKTAAEALEILGRTEKYRSDILFGLLRLDLTAHVEELLKEFITNGTKAEAIMATRALCGYRVIHIDMFENNKAIQRHVKQSCELAAGRMFYWITRTEFEALSRKQTAAAS
jgi:HEAT repeat protein